jgi:hypothetical protein
MFNIDIGVEAAFVASLVLLGATQIEKMLGASSQQAPSQQAPDILKGLTSSDFMTFHNYSDIKFIGMNNIAIIGAGIIILSLFLPWASVMGFSRAIISSGTGIWYLILALVSVAAIFMKNLKAGALVLTVAGGIGLLFNISPLFGIERAFLATGFYLYIIGSIAIIYAGVSRLKEMR